MYEASVAKVVEDIIGEKRLNRKDGKIEKIINKNPNKTIGPIKKPTNTFVIKKYKEN